MHVIKLSFYEVYNTRKHPASANVRYASEKQEMTDSPFLLRDHEFVCQVCQAVCQVTIYCSWTIGQ